MKIFYDKDAPPLSPAFGISRKFLDNVAATLPDSPEELLTIVRTSGNTLQVMAAAEKLSLTHGVDDQGNLVAVAQGEL